MNLRFISSPYALTLMSSTVWAQTPPVSDADYVMKASIGNTFEVEEAKLAVEQATDPRLKDFARKMITDHSDAEKKLKASAAKANLKAPTKLDTSHQAMLTNLKTYQDAGFDKIYIADQVAAHAETVALLSDYKQNGNNSDLKSWTNDALPIVKGHQAMINAM